MNIYVIAYIIVYDLAIHKRCTLGQVSRQLPSENIYPAVTQTIATPVAGTGRVQYLQRLMCAASAIPTAHINTLLAWCHTCPYIKQLCNKFLHLQ